jgi:hypothetical protein
MNERVNRVGFSQRIRLEWLRQTANLVLAGNDRETVYRVLQDFLKNKLSIDSDAERGSREKTITILMKIWLNVPPGLEAFRDDGLELVRTVNRDLSIALHWGMTMAVYPFWGMVAASVGRLLRLQGSFSVSHVQRRLREYYGERETVARAVRRVIRSYYDWQVIDETGEKGIYRSGRTREIPGISLLRWLIEALLHTNRDRRGNFGELLNNPALFPFRLERINADLLKPSKRIKVIKHNLSEDIIFLD